VSEPIRYARQIPKVPRVKACHRCQMPFRPKTDPFWCDACAAARLSVYEAIAAGYAADDPRSPRLRSFERMVNGEHI
jgi:hypothetical protein